VRSPLYYSLPLLRSTYKATATVAGLAAYLRGLQGFGYYTAASLKAAIIDLQWARPSYDSDRVAQFNVFPPAIYNGENQYLACNRKRQDGIVPSGCSIGSAPTGTAAGQASPITVNGKGSQKYHDQWALTTSSSIQVLHPQHARREMDVELYVREQTSVLPPVFWIVVVLQTQTSWIHQIPTALKTPITSGAARQPLQHHARQYQARSHVSAY
jgi:hypothetical protein